MAYLYGLFVTIPNNILFILKNSNTTSIPLNKRDELRTTPWGKMTYFEYKKKIEFSKNEYDEINSYCKLLGIDWSASAWDTKSIDFLTQYDLPFIKVPSDKW